MVIIENKKIEELKDLIEKSNQQLTDIFNEILNIQIDKIKVEKQLKLQNISEYEFEVIKTKAELNDKKELELYVKPIKKSRIKESIFCYWCLIYEEELLEKNIKSDGEMFLNKVLISELRKKKYYQSVFLEIENNKGKILETGTEIDFIEISKYIKEHKDEKYKALEEYFNELGDYVLLVGIKINKRK